MRSNCAIVVVLVAECILLASSASLNGTSGENIDSPAATEVVFDDSASEASNGNLEATTIQPLTGEDETDDSTLSDNIPQTTSTPCGNDVDSPDCPPDDFIDEVAPLSALSVNADDTVVSMEENATTLRP